jgi:hypothetical protein
MVFVDCTGPDLYRPGNWDSVVELETGRGYRPKELFNTGSLYDSMGIVKGYKVYW